MSTGATSDSLPRRMLGRLLRLLGMLTLVWTLLCAWIWFTQRSMLYYPQRLSESAAASLAERSGAIALREAGGQLIAWQFTDPGQVCSSHWLMAHGNAGMALQRAFVARHLYEQLGGGACLTVIEYPGYGLATGSPTKDSLTAQALASWSLLQAEPLPMYLIGESLGTGVVAELAARFPQRVAGIFLLTPYEDLAAVAASHFPWLPTRWLLRDRFEPAQQLAAYPGPVQLIVAGADRIIPPLHAQRLAAALIDVQVHVEAGLDHNDLQARPQWWALLRDLHERAQRRLQAD